MRQPEFFNFIERAIPQLSSLETSVRCGHELKAESISKSLFRVRCMSNIAIHTASPSPESVTFSEGDGFLGNWTQRA